MMVVCMQNHLHNKMLKIYRVCKTTLQVAYK